MTDASTRSGIRRLVVPALLLVTLSHSGRGNAQENAPGRSAANEPLGEILEEVVVTARLREERLLDVPIAISVLDNAQFEAMGAKSLADLSRVVPSLTLAPSAWGTQGVPIIRGIASNAGEATVSFYIDDTPVQIPNSDFQFGSPEVKLYDIERVEVLRGPQGTLFGSGAMGGTIRFITARPSLRDFTSSARLEVSETEDGEPTYEIGGALNGALKEDVVGLSVSGYYRDQGGYVDRISRTTGEVVAKDIDSQEAVAGKVGLLIAPSERFSITPAVFYQSIDYGGLSLFRPDLPDYQQQLQDDQPTEDRFVLPSLNIQYRFDSVSLTSITTYYERRMETDLDYANFISSLFGGTPIIPGFEDYQATSTVAFDQDVFTQEVRLASDDSGRLQYVLGAFYLDYQTITDQTIYEPQAEALMQGLFGAPYEAVLGLPLLPGDLSFIGHGVYERQALAGFGELTFALTDHFRMTGGLRAERSEVSGSRDADGPLNGGPAANSSESTETPITGKAAISYAPSERTHFYLQAANGYRAGGVNRPVPVSQCAADLAAIGLTEAPADYDSDGTWNYELGIKTELSAGRLALNAALFQVDWSDIQQAVGLPTCGFAFTGNFGEARSRGVELETVMSLTDDLTFRVSGSYNDAEFTSTVVSGADPGTGDPVIATAPGDEVPGVPEYTAALSLDYRFSLGSNWQAYLRGDYQYVGELFRTPPPDRPGFNALVYEQDSYDYASARIGMRRDGWDISAFVNNISNSRPIIGLSSEDDVTGQHLRASSFRPRTFGITLSKDFQ